MEKRVYELRKEWNDNDADEVYVLYWGIRVVSDDGREYVYSYYPGDTNHAGMLPKLTDGVRVHGNRDWAKRIATHYRIENPELVEKQ